MLILLACVDVNVEASSDGETLHLSIESDTAADDVGGDEGTGGDSGAGGVADLPSASEVFGDGPWLRVVTRDNTTCALHEDGHIECHGHDDAGEQQVPSGPWLDVGTTGNLTCGIHGGGTVICWGSDGTAIHLSPVGEFTQLAVDGSGACATRSDGSLACWGNDHSPPTSLLVDGLTLRSAGGSACALGLDDHPYCWPALAVDPPPYVRDIAAYGGWGCWINLPNQLECAPHSPSYDWLPSFPTAGIYEKVVVMAQSVCALRSDGGVDCWGAGAFDPDIPMVPLSSLDGSAAMCGIGRDDGDIYCWGDRTSWAP